MDIGMITNEEWQKIQVLSKSRQINYVGHRQSSKMPDGSEHLIIEKDEISDPLVDEELTIGNEDFVITKVHETCSDQALAKKLEEWPHWDVEIMPL